MNFKIKTPTLLLNKQQCLSNIKKIADKAAKSNTQLIPHFKTHQSAVIGEWFKDYGVEAISVTSVRMARYFAHHGWNDITIALPFNVLETESINELGKDVLISIFVNSELSAKKILEKLSIPVNFYIEIDTGYKRSGLRDDDIQGLESVLEVTRNSLLKFQGFYIHAGHTYDVNKPEEIKSIYNETLQKLHTLKKRFIKAYPELKISLGDTPSCSMIQDFAGVDSIRPGNFVYYDVMQNTIGSNSLDEIAICLAVPIVSIHPDRSELVTHSGWAHLGKDDLIDEKGNKYYGLVVKITQDGWSLPVTGAKVKKLSQEHGIISLPASSFNEFSVGDIIGILPVHACATAVMMGEVQLLSGEKLAMMPQQEDVDE